MSHRHSLRPRLRDNGDFLPMALLPLVVMGQSVSLRSARQGKAAGLRVRHFPGAAGMSGHGRRTTFGYVRLPRGQAEDTSSIECW